MILEEFLRTAGLNIRISVSLSTTEISSQTILEFLLMSSEKKDLVMNAGRFPSD